MAKFNWQNGTLVTPARVNIGGNIYDVTPEQYSGQTPLSAENLNAMQDALIDLIWPVGSYYETSDTSFNPNTAWGGTWVEDTEGLSTIAYKSSDSDFSNVGDIVGEKEHMITLNESYWNIKGQNPNAPQGGVGGWLMQSSYLEPVPDTHEPISLIQPSIIVKRWHRTA